MRRRLLLLCVGIASLGAIFASAVLANPTSTSSNVTPSGNVTVQPISGLSVSLASTDTEIIANNVAQKIANVMAGETDGDYDIAAIGVTVLTQGTGTGPCGAIGSTPYTISGTPPFPAALPDNGTQTDVGDLNLTLPVTVGNLCVVSGAVVQVTFEAQ